MQKEKSTFYKKIITLALPIGLQSLLQTSLSFVDTLMIGQLGDVAIASVGLANQFFFLVSLVFFGFGSGGAIFLSQFWGAKNEDAMQKVMGFVMVVCGSISLLFSLSSIFLPSLLMNLFTTDLSVVNAGSEYLRWVGISYIFVSVSIIISNTFRITGNARTPLIISFFSLSLNAFLNLLLIFGLWIFPRMGIAGAALATTISRFVELLLLVIVAHKKKSPAEIKFDKAFSFSKAFAKNFMKTTGPVVANEAFWALGMMAYKIAYSKMGIDVIASVNVTEAIQNLFFVIGMALANSVAIVLGNEIGSKRTAHIQKYALISLGISFGSGALMGLFMIIFSPYIPGLFNVSTNILDMTIRSLATLGILCPVKYMNMCTIVGILRSGGDTKYSFFAELTSVWFVGVPAAFIGGLILKLPIYNLYFLIGLEEVAKLAAAIPRILKKKWINDLTSVGEL